MSDMRIVIAEDLRMVRESIALTCRHDYGHEVVGETGKGADAIALCRRLDPEVLVLDLWLEDMDGFTVVEQLRHPGNHPPKILAFSAHCDEHTLRRVERMGVQGFVDKVRSPVATIGLALSTIESGRTFFGEAFQAARQARRRGPDAHEKTLTPWERTILGLIGLGLSDDEIARKISVAPRTVQGHRSHILRKLNLRGTPKLMAYALAHGLVDGIPPVPHSPAAPSPFASGHT